MKKLLSIAFIAVMIFTTFSCSNDEPIQESKITLVAKEEPGSKLNLLIEQQWTQIEAVITEYAIQNNIPQGRRWYPYCYTQGINYCLVVDNISEDIYKVTWHGGLSFSVQKIDKASAVEICRIHQDPDYYID